MAHMFDTGFTVRQPAWHGLGNVLAEAPSTILEARVAAGLTWEPRKVPAFQQHKELTGMDDDGNLVFETTYIEVPGAALIERDDSDIVIGHGVSMDFEPISNQTMFELVEALVQSGGVFDTAGSVRGGAVTWALARLDEPFTLPGDDTQCYPFVSVINHHDGSGSLRAQRGSVRIVCQNTIDASMLQSNRSKLCYSFRHTANVMERIDEAREAIAGARTDARHWQALANELLGLNVTTQSYNAFISEFIPEPPANVISERVRDNIVAARAKFAECYQSVTNTAHHGTGLGLVNTAVEYLDHLRAYRNADTYLNRTLLRPEPLKARAVALVKELCSA